MKKLFTALTFVFALGLGLVLVPQGGAKAAPHVSVSFQMFYNELAPYGQWIDDPNYGYVWAPRMNNDFRPYYSGGHWVMTEYGNTWVSDYDWGWAPFHYGRWTYDNYYGWVWIPGNEWGPAWVSWRSGGGYYGWAPMGPGININISLGNYYTPYDWWTFIPSRYIYSPGYYSYWRGPSYNNVYINQTTIINNYYDNRYVYGPRRRDVERQIGGRVTVYDVRNDSRPRGTTIQRNTVNIYRPQVVASNRQSVAPRNAVRAERPISTPTAHARNEQQQRAVNTRSNRFGESARPATTDNRINRQQEPAMQRAPEQKRQERFGNNDDFRNREVANSREIERQNEQRARQEQMERQNQARRQQIQQQQVQREQQQRVQQMQAERMQREQQINAQRQQRMQEQRMQAERQQRVQQQQRMEAERSQMRRSTMERPQREWRRPDPGVQRAPNSIERQPAQRSAPNRDRFGR